MRASIFSVTGRDFSFTPNDVAFAIDVWKTASTVSKDSRTLGASVILLHISRLNSSLPYSSHKCIINVFDKFLRNSGGESERTAQADEIALAGSHTPSSLHVSVIFPSYVPKELHQTAPEYFLIVDSAATVHVLWDTTLCAFVREENRDILWGKGRSVCTHIAHLCGIAYMLINKSKWTKVLLNSGTPDAWVVPTAEKQLFSQLRAKQQGHRCLMDGPKPGLLFNGDKDKFLPFVEDADRGFCLLPMYPPPVPLARHANLSSNSMKVLNLNASATAFAAHAQSGKKVSLKMLRNFSKLNVLRARREAALKRAKQKKAQEAAQARLIRKKMREATRRSDMCLYHKKGMHIHQKKLCKLKRTGKVIAARLPSKFLREYHDCTMCLAMKKRRKSLPKSNKHYKRQLQNASPWQIVQVDSSGKFRVRSQRGNFYFTVFVCAKTGDKIVLPHAKRKHFPLIYVEFVRRIGRHPKVMFSDKAGEITGKDFQRFLLTKDVDHIVIPKGEHHTIGMAEKAVQDLTLMTSTSVADANLPRIYWDYVVEHAALVNSMVCESACDDSITIFEAVHGAPPNIDLIPVVGCFAARLEEKSWKTDYKLDPRNQSGVFLGFATHEQIYGAQILAEKSIITARHQVAFDDKIFPFLEKDNTNSRMRHLQWLLGRKAKPLASQDDVSPCVDTEESDTLHQMLHRSDSCGDDSSDDEEVSNLMQDIEKLSQDPPFNILEPLPPKRTHTLRQRFAKKPAKKRARVEREGGTGDQTVRRSSRVRKRSTPPDSASPTKIASVKTPKTRRGSTPATSRVKVLGPSRITPDDVRVDKSLLVGRSLTRHFPNLGGFKGLVTKFILDKNVYELEYSDGWIEHITFEDALRLIPKAWAKGQLPPRNEEVLREKVEQAAFIAHISNSLSTTAKNGQYTTPKDFNHATDESRTPDFREWWEAILDEYYLLHETMKCWEIMDVKDLPKDANLIGTKWVFKLKFRNNEYERHKARIVAKGYLQREGKDYFASFSPTASYVTIRLVLALTALPFWFSVDLDATGAFISAPLPPNEQVYLLPIEGFDIGEGKCLKLLKTIYGLKQSPLAFYSLAKEVYLKCGLKMLKSDECVFYRYVQNIKGQPPLTVEDLIESGGFHTMPFIPESERVYKSCHYPVACLILVLYVDNNGVRHNCIELLEEFEAAVDADGRIDMHREGEMNPFLSVRYVCDPITGQIEADQEPYVDKIVKAWGMEDANVNKVPLHPSVDLDSIQLPAVVDTYYTGLFSQLVGELMFVGINTQPAIIQPLNRLARFMSNATKELFIHAKGVLRYLKGKKNRKVIFNAANVRFPFQPCELYAFSDASWADVVPSRKSSYSYFIFCNGAAFSWKSATATTLAMSSTEAELIALCACAADIAYCRRLANELGFHQWRPTVIHEDNRGAKQLAESGNFRGRSKHFELRWRFLTDYIRRGIVVIKAISRQHQLADIGCTARAAPQHEACCKQIYGEEWLSAE